MSASIAKTVGPVSCGVLAGTLVAASIEGVRVAAMGDGATAARAAFAASVSLFPLVWALVVVAAITLRGRFSWEQVQALVARTAVPVTVVGAGVFWTLILLASLLKHPALGAMLAAVLAMGAATVAWPLGQALSARIESSGQWKRRPGAVAVGLALGAIATVAGSFAAVEQVRAALPWGLLAGVLFGGGLTFAGLRAGWWSRRPAIGVVVAVTVVAVAASAPALDTRLGRASDGLTVSALGRSALRLVTDVDGDGVGLVLGDIDCAPFDPSIHPSALDLPGNGIDENCSGVDARPWQRPVEPKAVALPPALGGANVLFITVDTLRHDRTGFGGHTRRTTPNLDALAGRSIVFDNLQADSAATVSAFSAMWSGRPFYGQAGCEGDVYPPRGGWHRCKIHPRENSLPKRLGALGMTTSAVVSHNYFTGWGLEDGFAKWQPAYPPSRDLDLVSSEGVTVLAIKELERLRNERFFLWVHYFDPHGRYLDHDDVETFGPEPIDRYDAEIAHTDRFIGVLLKALRGLELEGKTIVVVASDHGEEFLEHGGTDHTWAVYDTSTRVPWILHLPGVGAGRVSTPVAQIDIGPTLVAAAGGQWPVEQREGVDLLPGLLRGEVTARPVFSEVHHPEPVGAVTWNGLKLVRHLRSGDVELYDQRADPLNLVDIAPERPEDVTALVELQDAWRAHSAARGEPHRASLRGR